MQHHRRPTHGVPRGPQSGGPLATSATTNDAPTALATAIEQEQRAGATREVNGFFGLANAPIYRIRFVVLRKQEENDALRAAHSYCVQQASGNDAALQDPDFTLDAKHVEILHRACKEDGSNRPAFPGPQWMRDKLTGDQIGVLLSIYNEVRAKCGPIDYDLSQESIDAIVKACADASETDLPDLVLERFPREVLSSMIVRLACMLRDAREDIEALETGATTPAAEHADTEPAPAAEQPGAIA